MRVVYERDDQDRFLHTFRQSTLGELDLCPERGRAVMTGEMPEVETDAACIGTAVHHGIEVALQGAASGDVLNPYEIIGAAQVEFNRLSQLPNFEWKKYKPAKATNLITQSCELFYDELYHKFQPVLIEHRFGPLVIYEDDERVIRIKGQIDLFDANEGAGDFKTTSQGRKYRRGFGGDAWQLDRWDIQPTVYIQALFQLGYLTGHGYSPDGPWPFTFFAFDLGKKNVELIETTVLRRPQDLEWLREKLLAYAVLCEARIEPWPKQDNHALCSPTWCDWWDQCKGAHYTEVEWPLKPAA